MRAIKYFAFAAVAATMLASCAKETEVANTASEGQFTYKFKIENVDTKATLNSDATAYQWNEGDKLGIYLSSDTENQYYGTLDADGDGAEVTVTLSKELTTGDVLYAYYPYSENSGSVSSAVLMVPSSQDFTTIEDAMPMYAEPITIADDTEINGSTLKMHNLGAVLKLGFYGSTLSGKTISKITWTANGISGAASTVDLTADSPAISASSGESIVTNSEDLSISVVEAKADIATYAYMVVTPGTYKGTISIETSEGDTYSRDLSSINGIEVAANALQPVIWNLDKFSIVYDFEDLAGLKKLAATSGEYTGILTDAIVTGVYVNSSKTSASYAYIQDANTGMMVYGEVATTLTAGKKISGVVTASAKTYNGNAEITALDITNATTEDATITATELTIDQLNEGFEKYDAMRVKLTGVDVTKSFSSSSRSGNIEEDEESIIAYVQFSSGVDGASAGENIDIEGYPGYYNTTEEFMVYSDDDITKNTILPEITITPSSITQNVGDDDVTISVTTESTGTVSFESSDETVATVSSTGVVSFVGVGSATITVSVAADGKYLANSTTCSVTVNAAGSTTKTIFSETFDSYSSGKGGNDDSWSGDIASTTWSDDSCDNAGWVVTKGTGAYKCAKFGTAKVKGSATTPSITATAGTNATLSFKAAAWSGDATTLNLSATGCTIESSSVTLVSAAWSEYTVTLSDVTAAITITFEGKQASKARFFLDEVKVTQAISE